MALQPFLLRDEVSHDEDVRGVSACPLGSGSFLSASRDRTAKLWTLAGEKYECSRTFVGHTHGVFQAIASGDHAITCSQDTTLIIWDIETGNPLTFLTGHTGPVSCCAVSPLDGRIVSGSWDSTAIIWTPDGASQRVLKGHTKNILCVCWLSTGNILTGSGDRTIIMWSPLGEKEKTITGHSDAVRSIKEVPDIGFISSSNDCTIILWSLTGDQLQIMAEHTNLVYCVAVLSSDEYASGSEDKTVRIWRGGECVQTIPHPSMIWDVCALDNGDIVTAGTDGKARIWTRAKEHANSGLIATLESILAQQEVSTKVVGGVDVSVLPGEDALLAPGTKDGQIKMIKRKNHPTAEVYTWSAYEGKWSKTGDLMDSPGDAATMGRQELNGVMYDYVFPVELNAGSGKFKLGYNRGENPFVAAQRFIWENSEQGIGQHFLDDIANFITQNVDQVQTPGVDESALHSEYAKEAARLAAEGQEAIMAPKEAYRQLEGKEVAFSNYMKEALQYEQEEKARLAGIQVNSSSQDRKQYPVSEYIKFSQSLNADGILKKVTELSNEVGAQSPELALTPADTATLSELIKVSTEGNSPNDVHIALLQKLLSWPEGKRFPAVDIIRDLLLKDNGAQVIADPRNYDNVLSPLLNFLQGTSAAPEQMLLSRALTNMFANANTLALVTAHAAEVLQASKGLLKSKANNIRQSFASLLQNYAVYIAKVGITTDVVLALCPIITEFLLYEAQPPVLLSLCAGVGTLLHSSSKVRVEALEGFNKCFLPDCLKGKTTFGDADVIQTAKALIDDFFE